MCQAMGFRSAKNVVPELVKEFQRMYPVILDEGRCTFNQQSSCQYQNQTQFHERCLDHESDIWLTCHTSPPLEITCIPGQYWSTASQICQECPQNFYSNQASFSCSRCPFNTVSKKGSSTCSTCPVGHRWVKSSCIRCPANHFGNGVECVECPEGTVSSDNTVCVKKELASNRNVMDIVSTTLISLVLIVVVVQTALKIKFRQIPATTRVVVRKVKGSLKKFKEKHVTQDVSGEPSTAVTSLPKKTKPTQPPKPKPTQNLQPKPTLPPKAKPRSPMPAPHHGAPPPQVMLPVTPQQQARPRKKRQDVPIENVYSMDGEGVDLRVPEAVYCDGYGL